ncbi:MAG: creatininase family protein [Veillonellales bacterium]
MLIGEALSVGVAAELGSALVASTIRPGCSNHHLSFAGSLSISQKLLEGIIEAYCDNLKNYGFRNIVLLPSHGGNFDCVASIGEKLKTAYKAEGVNVIALADRDGYINAFAEPLYSCRFSFDQVGVHAGAGETALVMALRPELVRGDKFDEGFVGKIDIAKLLFRLRHRISELIVF